MPPKHRHVRNFYEADDDDEEELPSRAAVPAPHPRVEDLETIEMDSDDNESGADETRRSPLPPSLAQLREGVEQSKREIRRINLLILRAVWKHIIAHRARDPSRPLGPATVDTPGRGLSSNPHRSGHSFISRDPSLFTFAHLGPAPSLLPERPGGRNAPIHHQRPFLPPSRYPLLPDVDADEYSQLNRNLYRAVVEAGRRGMLGAGGDAASSSSKTATATGLGRSLFAGGKGPDGVSPSYKGVMPSLRAAALRKATEEQQPSRGRTEKTVAVKLSTEGAEPAWAPSLSLLILQVAKERAVATLFLRQLRVAAHLRRATLAEVEARFQYYRQRRALRGWLAYTARQRDRRHFILSTCVAIWVEAAAERRAFRDCMRSFRRGLAQRRSARDQCTATRTRHYLHRWRDAFTERRVERSLNAAVESFRRTRETECPVPRFIALHDPRCAELASVTDGFLRAHMLSRMVQHWRARAAARVALREAALVYSAGLQLRAIRRMRAHVADAAALLTGQRRTLWAAVREAADLGRPADLGALEPARIRTFVVRVSPAPPHTLRYKAATATRIAQGRGLRAAFAHWRGRAEGRRADAFRTSYLRVAALRTWLDAAARRRQARGVLRSLVPHWQLRLAYRRDGAAADAAYRRALAARCFAERWHGRLLRRREHRRELSVRCLRRWLEQASSRVAARVLRSRQQRALFHTWRQRAATRFQRRTAVLVADTVRETILLLSGLRWWRERAAQCRHARLAGGVLRGLTTEKQLRLCFARWKKRLFGPHLPPPLPALRIVSVAAHTPTSISTVGCFSAV